MNVITPKELAEALERKGFRLKRGGDHNLYYLFHNDKITSLRIPISRGSRHNYSGNLLSRVIKQMHLNKKQFIDFVSCPMTEAEYIQLLQSINELPCDNEG